MAHVTRIPDAINKQIVVDESAAQDIILLADQLKSLLLLRQGQAMIGLSPEAYAGHLRSLLAAIHQRDDEPQSYDFNVVTVDELRTIFARNLNRVLDEQGYPPKGQGRQIRLAEKFGVEQTTARKWLEAIALPEVLMIVQLSLGLGCSLDTLLLSK